MTVSLPTLSNFLIKTNMASVPFSHWKKWQRHEKRFLLVIILSVDRLHVNMLSVIMQSIIILIVIMMSIYMLSVNRQSVVRLIVIALSVFTKAKSINYFTVITLFSKIVITVR
jgi:hypothetical protein